MNNPVWYFEIALTHTAAQRYIEHSGLAGAPRLSKNCLAAALLDPPGAARKIWGAAATKMSQK